MEMKIDNSAPVLVTGATGYVAGWVIKRLLEEGLTIHATVRDPSKTEKLKYLLELEREHEGTLKFFKADLLDAASFAEGMEGCATVFHIASPFVTEVKDPQKDLVDPAVGGTRAVLEEAGNHASVKRIVLTSSCAAIYGDAVDLADAPNGVFTEELWNTSSSLSHQPYSYSKTMAEKAAWEVHDAQDQWKLVVVNPSFVLGPGINPFGSGESQNTVRQMGDGTFKSGVPDMKIGVIDVRDLAEAHLRAAFVEDAEGRHIISGHNAGLLELADGLKKFRGQFPVPKGKVPKALIWLIGPFVNKAFTRKVVAKNIGHPWKADNAKSKRALGMSYRPLEVTIQDAFQQMVDTGQLTAK